MCKFWRQQRSRIYSLLIQLGNNRMVFKLFLFDDLVVLVLNSVFPNPNKTICTILNPKGVVPTSLNLTTGTIVRHITLSNNALTMFQCLIVSPVACAQKLAYFLIKILFTIFFFIWMAKNEDLPLLDIFRDPLRVNVFIHVYGAQVTE